MNGDMVKLYVVGIEITMKDVVLIFPQMEILRPWVLIQQQMEILRLRLEIT